MKTINKWLTSIAICAITFIGAFMVVVQPSIGQEEEEVEYTNLQIFPEDIGEERLMDIMQNWEAALGVGCDHCHEAYGRGDPRNDFASDVRQPKLVTRLMIENIIAFNRTLTAEALGKPQDDIETAQCSTCHQGNAIPPVFVPPED